MRSVLDHQRNISYEMEAIHCFRLAKISLLANANGKGHPPHKKKGGKEKRKKTCDN